MNFLLCLKGFAFLTLFLLRQNKVFARLFQKAVSSTDSGGRAPQSAKSYFGVFFLIAFSFAPALPKEKADGEFAFSFVCWLYLDFAW